MRVSWRYLFKNRRQTLLMVIGIAFGVALIVAVDLANSSAQKAFELSVESLTGKSTHSLVGGVNGIPEIYYSEFLAQDFGVPSSPLVLQVVSSPQMGGRPLQLMGIDPLRDKPFRDYLGDGQQIPIQQLVTFITKPGALIISGPFAQRYGLSIGSRVLIYAGGSEVPAFIAGIIEPVDPLEARKMDGLLIADISTAQEISGQIGMINRVDLILPSLQGIDDQIEYWLPAGVRLEPSGSLQNSLDEMTEAFRHNLAALSMLALIVGLFLIYNTMTFSVVQRRNLFGSLRSIGVTSREIFRLIAFEALVFGLIGSIAGVALGLVMGRQSVSMVTQTINDLYYATTVQDVGIPLASLVKGLLVGILATLITALVPAWEASRIPARAVMVRSGFEQSARKKIKTAFVIGLGFLTVSLGIFLIPGGNLPLGFLGTTFMVLGFSLCSGLALVGFLGWSGSIMGRFWMPIGKMAPRSLINSLSRTSVAVASLMVAITVASGMTLLINSFRNTVISWLETTLQGDIYISSPSFSTNTPMTPIAPGVIDHLSARPGIKSVDLLRSVWVDSDVGQVRLSAMTNKRLGYERQFLELSYEPDVLWEVMRSGAVIISEPLARKGNFFSDKRDIQLFTADGWRSFPVAGIYYDYTSNEGSILMEMAYYQKVWNDHQVTAMDIRLLPGVDPDQAMIYLQDSIKEISTVSVRSNKGLREDVLEVFDRTFAITYALRIMATLVAFFGILNTLMLQQLEKQREIGVLRALGLTNNQMMGLILLETSLMGLISGILAVPAGYILSLVLIFVINQRSFGWTLQYYPDIGTALQAFIIALVAALLAAIYPAIRVRKMSIANVIRNE